MEVGGLEEGERVPLREDSQGESGVPEAPSRIREGTLQWLTVDGPLGVQQEEAVKLARSFFHGGFCLLPWLWFVNCFYFAPVLCRRAADVPTRQYIVWSGVGCVTFTILLLAWALTFAYGGERLFGELWKHLAVFDLADKYTMAWAQ